jgi:hypothetical protein
MSGWNVPPKVTVIREAGKGIEIRLNNVVVNKLQDVDEYVVVWEE